MDSKFNKATKDALSSEIKKLRVRCLDTCNIVENSYPDQNIPPSNVGQIAMSYVEGLRTQIESSETVIPTDENLIINQFLSEIKVKNDEVQKLIAFTKGSISDVNNEIQRLEDHISKAEEALKKPRVDTQDVSVERVGKAKEDFSALKAELHALINSVFRDDSKLVFDISGQLMQERLKAGSDGYIQVTEETFRITELLNDINIVSKNPYNENQVKLTY